MKKKKLVSKAGAKTARRANKQNSPVVDKKEEGSNSKRKKHIERNKNVKPI